MMRRICVLFVALLTLTGCGFAGAGGGGGKGESITVAVVSNPQMQDMQELIGRFHEEHPGIDVRFVSLPENESRQKTAESVSTGSGEFDVVMISNYETPIWARNGWLRNLGPDIARTPGYDQQDFVPTVRKALSYQGNMYSVPFYGESSFLMYRKDLFAKKGLVMPPNPSWQQVAALAAKLNDPGSDTAGICLRGLPGWGELMAPLSTVINTFGGRWFDPKWRAQLESPQVREAVRFYVDLLRKYGEPGAAAAGFTQCLNNFAAGNSAMWYDSTSAVSTLEDPKSSKVAGKVGYVAAPVQRHPGTGWLYSWSLGIPKTSEHADAAWKFVSWATSKHYIGEVGKTLGWSRVPPASRLSTYERPGYRKLAGAFAKPTLDAINSPTIEHPTAKPVPYTGGQFVDIPEFIDLGTRVSQQLSAAIAGQKSVDDALAQSQEYAATVGASYGGR
ncbi:ABC transporter substrate-binding protein [Sciscionella sediminilitoris]|uniref:ABC transporter substrate-binding protein n=1 Tax=Sciscionella sediminilitoris TaxID=1445613 RepID=UPI000689A7F4|nr:sugar ABC transporter substrate-binding protein [Sciscionella sp. SE31]